MHRNLIVGAQNWCSTTDRGGRGGRRRHAQGLYIPLRAGETTYNGLFRRLQQMEMRGAASPRPWVGPPRDDFRIGHDLVIQQEQGYIGELFEQVIANFP